MGIVPVKIDVDAWGPLEREMANRGAGHVRVRLPETEAKAKTANQRKVERRRARGKR